jgi:quercetin dioxygenase-like cupin family protein
MSDAVLVHPADELFQYRFECGQKAIEKPHSGTGSQHQDDLTGLDANAPMTFQHPEHSASFQEELIYHQDLSAFSENLAVRAVELTFAPGTDSAPVHRHEGFVIGYVLEGVFRFQVEGQPEVVLSAGEMFYEPPGSIHLTAGNASSTESAKVLALVFGEAGTPLSLPL